MVQPVLVRPFVRGSESHWQWLSEIVRVFGKEALPKIMKRCDFQSWASTEFVQYKKNVPNNEEAYVLYVSLASTTCMLQVYTLEVI